MSEEPTLEAGQEVALPPLLIEILRGSEVVDVMKIPDPRTEILRRFNLEVSELSARPAGIQGVP